MSLPTAHSQVDITSSAIPDVIAAGGLNNDAISLPVLSQRSTSRTHAQNPPDLEQGVHHPPPAEERRHWETRIKVMFGIAIISLQLLHLGVLYAFRNSAAVQISA